MPSKELINEVSYRMAIADAYGESPIPDPSRFRRHAEAAISTIFAALQEPTEAMTANGYVHCYNPERTWSAMLAASALGEQSYRAEIISADGAVWDETAPGTRNFKRREQSE